MNCNSSSSITTSILPPLCTLVVGYRFHPTDEELIINYLKPKIQCPHKEDFVIGEVNVCRYEPWDLPDLSKITSDDEVWYFFCPCNFKYSNSRRFNRKTNAGHWKPTGKPIPLKAKRYKKKIGTKKTLVFYKGKGKGVRTGWIMHEYNYIGDSNLPNQGGFVLCKLKKKPEKIHKGESNNNVAFTSNLDSGESSPNPSELMTNSAGNESELSHHMTSDFENQNSNEILVSSSFNEGGLHHLIASDPENESISDISQLSPSQFESECSWGQSSAIPSNLDNNGESSSQQASDRETQNLVQGTDISTFDKGERSAAISALSDFGDQNHRKADILTHLEQFTWSQLLALVENKGEEAAFAEENPQTGRAILRPGGIFN